MTHRKKWMAVTLAALAVSSLAIGLAGLFLLHASLLKTAAEQRDLVQDFSKSSATFLPRMVSTGIPFYFFSSSSADRSSR